MATRLFTLGVGLKWKMVAVCTVVLLSFAGLTACETASVTIDSESAARGVASAARDAAERDRDAEAENGAADRQSAVADRHNVVTMFPEAEERYDDIIGFEEFEVVVSEDAVEDIMGDIRRRFLRIEDVSPLEVARHYQQAIEAAGGTVLFQSRDPQSIEIDEKGWRDYFIRHREDRGMSTYVFDYWQHPGRITEYVAGVVPSGGTEVYVLIGAGRADTAQRFTGVRYEIVTIVVD